MNKPQEITANRFLPYLKYSNTEKPDTTIRATTKVYGKNCIGGSTINVGVGEDSIAVGVIVGTIK
ncbi:MAG: hypothetical protein ACQCN3_05220 [Candidatus Bathyarchaeia archaeon]|jgi:hypothetical protein